MTNVVLCYVEYSIVPDWEPGLPNPTIVQMNDTGVNGNNVNFEADIVVMTVAKVQYRAYCIVSGASNATDYTWASSGAGFELNVTCEQ